MKTPKLEDMKSYAAARLNLEQEMQAAGGQTVHVSSGVTHRAGGRLDYLPDVVTD